MDAERSIAFVDAAERGRYEARVDGRADVAFAAYERRGNQIVFTHTEVPSALSGQGVGTALAAFAVADARRRGLEIIAECPFIRAYLKRHPADAATAAASADEAAIDEAIIETFPASDPPSWMP